MVDVIDSRHDGNTIDQKHSVQESLCHYKLTK